MRRSKSVEKAKLKLSPVIKSVWIRNSVCATMKKEVLDEKTHLLNNSKNGHSKKKRKYYLDVATFLVYFGVIFSKNVTTNQILVDVCATTFSFNQTLCDQIGKSGESSEIKVCNRNALQLKLSKIVVPGN